MSDEYRMSDPSLVAGGTGTINVSNIVFNPSSTFLVDVQPTSNDLLVANSCQFNGSKIVVRWNWQFMPTLGQRFKIVQANNLIFNPAPVLQNDDAPYNGLPPAFDLKLVRDGNNLFLEVVAAD